LKTAKKAETNRKTAIIMRKFFRRFFI